MTTAKVIVALDFQDQQQTLAFVERLDPALCRLKVATTLFTGYGPALVESLQQRGFDVFLDLKFYDIPHQVAGACKMAAELGVWMVDCHLSGGLRMLMAAREALSSYQNPPLLIGVSMLTSFSNDELLQIGINNPLLEQQRCLIDLAKQAECDGIVCSAQDLESINIPKPLITVTPGIRFENDSQDDQRRVVTPQQAFALGATYLVMGRSITASEDPIALLKSVE